MRSDFINRKNKARRLRSIRAADLLRLTKLPIAQILTLLLCSSFGWQSSMPNVSAQAEIKANPTPTPAGIVAAVKNPGDNLNSPAAPNDAAPSVVAEQLIHLGDVIDIDFLGSVEYDWRGSLDSEGFLSQLPYAEHSIFGLCRTESELAAEIAENYKKVLRQPEIVVRVVDRSARQPAVLLGAVRTQMRLQIERPVRLNELVVVAGGITERASGEVSIFRPANLSCGGRQENQAQSATIKVNLAELLAGKDDANPFIRTGDVVTVEEAKPIFVTGAVAAPQTVLFRGQITLSRSLASAGGLSKNGDGAKITIYRRSGAETKIIAADFEKIRKKMAEDVALEAYDIVEVEQKGSGKSKRPPTVAGWEAAQTKTDNLPLRIIN